MTDKLTEFRMEKAARLVDSFESDEELLGVYQTVIDALRKKLDMREVIDLVPKKHQPEAIRFLEFVKSDL